MLILRASFAAFLPVRRSYKMLVVEAWNAQDNVVVQLSLESDESYSASSVVRVPETFTKHQAETFLKQFFRDFIFDVVAFHSYFVEAEREAQRAPKPLNEWCYRKNSFCHDSRSGLSASLSGCHMECEADKRCSSFAHQAGDAGDDGVNCYLKVEAPCKVGDASQWDGGYVTLYCKPGAGDEHVCGICPGNREL
jgi:hypothetical protein